MLHIRKKILVGALCASMVLSASQSVAWSESNSMTAEAGSAEAGSEESAADTAEAETSTAEASTSEAEWRTRSSLSRKMTFLLSASLQLQMRISSCW